MEDSKVRGGGDAGRAGRTHVLLFLEEEEEKEMERDKLVLARRKKDEAGEQRRSAEECARAAKSRREEQDKDDKSRREEETLAKDIEDKWTEAMLHKKHEDWPQEAEGKRREKEKERLQKEEQNVRRFEDEKLREVREGIEEKEEEKAMIASSIIAKKMVSDEEEAGGVSRGENLRGEPVKSATCLRPGQDAQPGPLPGLSRAPVRISPFIFCTAVLDLPASAALAETFEGSSFK